MNHEVHAAAGVFHVEVNHAFNRHVLCGRINLKFHLRERVQAGEVGEIFLWGVDGVFFVLPVHSVELGGEPVEIVADQSAGGIVELEFQEIGGGEIRRCRKIERFGGCVGDEIDRCVV